MTVTMVGGHEPDVVVATIDARTPDLSVVDSLMRWKLAALRQGRELRLRNVPEALRALLELVGLAEVLALEPLVLEPRRKAEGREQLGIEEVMKPDDLAT